MRKTILNCTTSLVSFTIILVIIMFSIFRTSGLHSVGAAADTPEERGESIFLENCSGCHHAHLTETKIGPGLKGLFKQKTLPASNRPVSEHNVRLQLKDPYKNMPVMADILSEKQINDLIAFLENL
jgi:mono/diheme cytochrome c family protein